MNGPLLPGGEDSLVALLNRYPAAIVELKASGFIRTNGGGACGHSYQRYVWDSAVAAGRVPATVRAFDFSDDQQFAAFIAAKQEESV